MSSSEHWMVASAVLTSERLVKFMHGHSNREPNALALQKNVTLTSILVYLKTVPNRNRIIVIMEC